MTRLLRINKTTCAATLLFLYGGEMLRSQHVRTPATLTKEYTHYHVAACTHTLTADPFSGQDILGSPITFMIGSSSLLRTKEK
jgi:hypothetical protein